MATLQKQTRLRLRSRVQNMVKGNDLFMMKKGVILKLSPWGQPLRRCLELWRQGGTEASFQELVEAEYPGAWSEVARSYAEMVEKGFFEEMDLPHGLIAEDAERWGRTIDFFSEFEEGDLTRFDMMERLRKSRVLVVGLGGMGSWVLYQLLCLGVGNIYLIDGDRVELANLNRAILYTPQDVGEYKVEAAIRVAKKFAPTSKVEGHVGFLSSKDDLAAHLQDIDLVIGCADQPLWLIRQWVTDACMEAGVPLIMAGGGKVGPLTIPGETACPMCVWTQLVEERPGFAESVETQRQLPRGHSGGLSTVAAMVAGVMVLEAVRFLSGYSKPTTQNALWELGPDLSAKITPLARHPRCYSCSEHTVTL